MEKPSAEKKAFEQVLELGVKQEDICQTAYSVIYVGF